MGVGWSALLQYLVWKAKKKKNSNKQIYDCSIFCLRYEFSKFCQTRELSVFIQRKAISEHFFLPINLSSKNGNGKWALILSSDQVNVFMNHSLP